MVTSRIKWWTRNYWYSFMLTVIIIFFSNELKFWLLTLTSVTVGYIIEKQRLKTKWLKVVTLEPSVQHYCVENLKEKSEYYFKVYAENSVGLSEPALTDLVSLETHSSKLINFLYSLSICRSFCFWWFMKPTYT